ncbi:MAG TPA: Fic family protein [Jatrophihabitans sp.]
MKENVVSSIVFAADQPAATISRRVARGALRRLASGVYTTDVNVEPTAVIKREWHTIVGGLLPAAVITDRSAPTGGPVDGILYLAHEARNREINLPGLIVLARHGMGPMDGDTPLPDGLYLASKGRALAENTRPSRARGGRARRTLGEAELGDWIDRLCQIDGEEKLARYRVQAEVIAEAVGAPETGIDSLSRLVGVALGTQRSDTGSKALAARQARLPYDHDRIQQFGRLMSALRASAPQNRPVDDLRGGRYRYLPFFEAYFSNFIEGTEFDIDEAVAIVYDGKEIPGRADDSHDLIGTYRIVSDLDEMMTTATSGAEFLQLLRSRHASVLAGRPDKNPGQFKEVANRAGNTSFVLPGLVPGTLSAGWQLMAELDTAFERAVYMMFLVAEVHPFDDGNGRLARIMMNCELVSARQSRIIIPTVYRDDYLGALRRLSRQDDPAVLIKALRYGQDYTAQINFSERGGAIAQLTQTNAFNEPNSDDRLVLPRS